MVTKIIDSYNTVVGGIVAILSYVLGEHWILFAAFLGLNFADWLTGWIKSRLAGKESSVAGLKGVLKKLCYWIMIMISFGASAVFMEIGKVLNINLRVTSLLGWFVLASLLINEARSVVENLVESGAKVPHFLKEGLDVAEKMIDSKEEE